MLISIAAVVFPAITFFNQAHRNSSTTSPICEIWVCQHPIKVSNSAEAVQVHVIDNHLMKWIHL